MTRWNQALNHPGFCQGLHHWGNDGVMSRRTSNLLTPRGVPYVWGVLVDPGFGGGLTFVVEGPGGLGSLAGPWQTRVQ